MSFDIRSRRDVRLKPRESGNLPPEKLRSILSRIYPEETVSELMGNLFSMDGGGEDDKRKEAD